MDIEKEYLIAVANNSTNIINHLDVLIETILSYNILSEEEIRNFLCKKKIMSVIQMLTNYAIFRYVNESSESIINCFDDQFLNIDLTKVLQETNKLFEDHETKMFDQTKNKLWIEVLRTCCFYYIRRLIYLKKKPKTIDEITSKMKADIKFLNEVFLNKLGENTIKENTKTLEKFLEFLETPPDMISLACYSIREYNGPTFNFEMARALIELRVDFTSADKKASIVTCKEVLDNYKVDESETAKNNPLLEYILMERKNLAKRVSRNDGLESVDEMEKSDRKIDNIRRGTINISDFLGKINEIPDTLDNKTEFDNRNSSINSVNIGNAGFALNMKKKEEPKVDADVSHSGYMMKKSNSK